jgi:putative ABC transport system ATP-binding protein
LLNGHGLKTRATKTKPANGHIGDQLGGSDRGPYNDPLEQRNPVSGIGAPSQIAPPPERSAQTGASAAGDIDQHAPDWIIQVDRVSKTYGQGDSALLALNQVSLHVPRGRMVALLGRSGSGKSTLLNLLGAMDRPSAGAVRIGGVDLTHMTDAKLALFRRRSLGFVFQSFHLLADLTVFDNVVAPWALDRSLTAARRDEALALLDRLGVADKARRYPDELSGGQQQRVALARAVIHKPMLLLADEPTGNLDTHGGRVILDLLQQLQRETGVSIVMATHADEAAARCEDRVTLDDGRIVAVSGAVRCEAAA